MRDRAGAATLSRGAAPYTSLREWRAQAVAGKTPTDVVLRKAYTCEKIVTVDAAARQKQFVISTASVDREGDTVAPEGWVLDEYRANPVVLWAHDGEQPPIGQTVRMGVDGGRKLLSIVRRRRSTTTRSSSRLRAPRRAARVGDHGRRADAR